jgi:hypothetical protein
VHPSLLSPVRVLGHRCNDRHNRCNGVSSNLRILGTYISRNGRTSENPLSTNFGEQPFHDVG